MPDPKKPKAAGGWPAIRYSIKVAFQVGIFPFLRTIFSRNSCKTCALGMGGQSGGMRNEQGDFPEICKKSMQAQLTDIQPGISNSLFQKKSIDDFKKLSGRELERVGRLACPLYKGSKDTHYQPISWEEALQKIVAQFQKTSADRTFFYSSGRSSNEAAFLLQLFARVYGTNNVNNCSYYCHQASGVGMTTSLGTGTATIVLEDLHQSDLIFVIGANPASNHPRFLRELMLCRRRGGEVVVINPLKELGLVRFAVPSDLRSMVAGGSEIASLYLQPNIGSDIAVLKGIAKCVIEAKKYDLSFVQQFTNDWEAYLADIEQTSWASILESSGLKKSEIEQVAQLYMDAKNVVFSWAMGITHHEHGVNNVQSITNLALLRGMVGRKDAGLLPLRGHSNVQGVGSVGFTPVLKNKIFENIQKEMQIQLPTEPGLDTMACMHAALENKIDLAFLLGGNLYQSNPDSQFAERALMNIPCTVYLTTTLNKGHFHGAGQESFILPVAARDEEKQATTQESMFNFVRMSDGGIVRLKNIRSEVEIISEIAARVLPNHPISFKEFQDHQQIRKSIAKIVPGFEQLETIMETKKEFQISGRTFHEPKFATSNYKANFAVVPIPELPREPDEFYLMTMRSEGQFNSIIYDEEDLYRGQNRRDIVLMNPTDIQKLGLQENDPIRVVSSAGSIDHFLVREFDVPPGNIAMYFPEANVLVPTNLDQKSKTPSFKSIRVKAFKSRA